MNLFKLLKAGVAWCKFPWKDYNRRGTIFAMMHGKNGAVIRRCGNDWTVEIDGAWLDARVRRVVDGMDLGDEKPNESGGSSGDGGGGGGGGASPVDIEKVIPGIGLSSARKKTKHGSRLLIDVDAEWIKDLARQAAREDAESEAQYEVDLGDHYGATYEDETPKTLADEDDEWLVEKDEYEGAEFLTEADKPLETESVRKLTISHTSEGVDTIHHFEWLNTREQVDSKGNVVKVEAVDKGEYDLRIQGEEDPGLDPPCGNPINDPGRGHGGGGDPGDPLDEPSPPCGPEPGDGEGDYPPIF